MNLATVQGLEKPQKTLLEVSQFHPPQTNHQPEGQMELYRATHRAPMLEAANEEHWMCIWPSAFGASLISDLMSAWSYSHPVTSSSLSHSINIGNGDMESACS